MTPDEPAASSLDAALERIAASRRLLVALDFDGTLAPEVDDPLAARALPAAAEALEALQALPQTIVALVSGRSLDSLAHVGQLAPGTPLVGSHGLEVRLDEAEVEPAVDERDRQRVETLRSALAPLVDAVDGAWIEDKPAGFAVHTRVVARDAAHQLQRDVRAQASELDPALTVRDGKNVVEFAVRNATKGDGLRILRERLGVDAVLFAGDDVTDEDALRALEQHDLGIKVGPAATIAAHRVADPAALAALLAELAVRRRGILSASAR